MRVLWLSVLVIEQLHKALHVPDKTDRGQKATLHMLTNNMAINLKTSPAAIKAALWQAYKEHFWRECLTIFARV